MRLIVPDEVERGRIRHGALATGPMNGFNGAFVIKAPFARPMHPDWVREIRDQCQAAGVSFFFKQWGGHLPINKPWEQDDPKRLADNEQWLNLAGGQGFHGDQVYRMRRVGKHNSGRVLDGRTWDEFPEAEVAK